MKKMTSLLLVTIIFISSCSKKDSDMNAPASAIGFWIGATNTYGVGTLIRNNGTARQYWNTSNLTLGDTSRSSVLKYESTYIISGDSMFITGPSSSLKGKMNTGFSSMQGASSLSGGGLTVKQSFIMSK